jgi:uridine phosphorylase
MIAPGITPFGTCLGFSSMIGLNWRPMSRREFAHANNPDFACAGSVLLLPFGRRSFLSAIVEAWGGGETVLDETTDREVYQLRAASSPVTLVYSGMGSPAAANALEMVAAAGAERVVVFGACGGVSAKVGVGELVVATGAVRGEGTSAYYAPPGFPAAFDPLLTVRLGEAVSASEVSVHRGVVFTTDAGYRQGPEIYEQCAGLVIAVESECAAVAVVGARLGLQTGALLFCTDNVSLSREEDRGYRGLADLRVRRGFEVGLDVVITTLSGLLE